MKNIQQGMDIDEVEKIIGLPIQIIEKEQENGDIVITYIYEDSPFSPSGNWISFNKEGRVVDLSTNYN